MDPWQIVAALAAVLASTWAAFIAGFFKGDLIPGHVYRRVLKALDLATNANEQNAKAIRDLTDELREQRRAPPGG